MEIKTNRLFITEFNINMAESVHLNSLDEDNRRFVPDEVFETVEDAAETVEFLMSCYTSGDGPLVYPVLLKYGTYIGYVQAVPLENGTWEIGYHIGGSYTGQGYATEAVTAFLPIIMKQLGITEIAGICLAENAASVKVMERCGFTKLYEGKGSYQGQEHVICKFVYTLKSPGQRIIKTASEKYKDASLDFVEKVFTASESAEDGKLVRRLVAEIRSKKYYLPELDLIMTDENDEIIGLALFSRFHIEGRYEDELLLLSPVAVKTELQRRHISKDLIEYGLQKAKELGYRIVLVEGNPKNYHARGFKTSADYGVYAGDKIKLPHVDCMMIQELVPGALDGVHGFIDYGFYETLR